MARNDLKQNPEAGSDGIREPEQVPVDVTPDDAELLAGDTDDTLAEDLLLEKDLSEIMKNVPTGINTEPVAPAADEAADGDGLDISFGDSEEEIEIPIPVEDDDEPCDLSDYVQSMEESKPDDTDAIVQPAEESGAKGKFAAFFGSAFRAGKKADKAELPEQEAEEPSETAPAEPDTDELAFVADAAPAAVGLMAQATAGLSETGEADGAAADEEPETIDESDENLITDDEAGVQAQENIAGEKAPREKKPESPYMPLVRMVTTLTVICCAVALLLAVVNAVTVDVISANAEKKQSDAILRIFTEGNNVVADGENLWLVYKDDTLLGYCAAVAPFGYGGAINMMVGVDSADQVVGVQIVDMKETSGVGSKAASDTFLSQYLGQSGPFAVGDTIDAIVGATVTSKAVTEGVNMALELCGAGTAAPETEPVDAVPVEPETEPAAPETEKETETEPETETETETTPETEKETEVEIEPETEKKPETIPPETVPPVPETKPETTPPAPETKPETTPPAPETKPETTPPAPETKPETTPPAPETKPETTPPAPETEPETTPPAPETEPETTPPVPETEAETEPVETEPETEAETEPETEPETAPETEPETEAETETEKETEKETTGSRLPIRY